MSATHEIVVSWFPGKGQPIRISSIEANGKVVVTDDPQSNSPVCYDLPPPDANNQFAIQWTITPDVDNLQWIALVVRRNDNHAAAVPVDRIDNPGRNPWKGSKTVNAP